MKKIFYACIGALFALVFSANNARSQTISYYNLMGNGCYFLTDSVTVQATGATGTETIETFYGDGTSDVNPVSFYSAGTDYFNYSHYYAMSGTYTIKMVLRTSSGSHVDSVTFSTTYTYCHMMTAYAYFDVNGDCVNDMSDNNIPTPVTVEIDSMGYPVDTITTTWGVYYTALGPIGTGYAFKVINNPYGFTPSCPASGIVYDTVRYVADTFHALAFSCDPALTPDNVLWAFTSCGTNGEYVEMGLSSTSCTAITQTVTLTHSPKYTITHLWDPSGISYPYTSSGNTITFSVPGISAATTKYFNALFAPVGTLTIGDTAHTSITLAPLSPDHDPANNVYASVDTIRSSYDPNDKKVQPEGNIAAGTSLKYLINFENTGNDTAHNIHIQDTLSDNVNVNSIKVLGSSARVVMTLSNYAGHNVVKFDFPNINLLDSSHHGKCDGFVQFSVSSKSGLSNGTKIDNRAGIYFDYNEVVMTNTVENVIGTLGTSGVMGNTSHVTMYPNPVKDILTISMDKDAYNTLSISNIVGQVMQTQQLNGTQAQVNVSALPAGVYLMTLRGTQGVKVQQFEKL